MDWKCTLHNRLFLFVCACLSGVVFALIWRSYERKAASVVLRNTLVKTASLHDTKYATWLNQQNLRSELIPEEDLRYGKKHFQTESDFLYQKVPVLCLVRCKSSMGATAAKNTWTKHCNHVLLWGDFQDDSLPVIKIEENVQALTRYVWKKFAKKFHWVLAVNDHTFAIVENLRVYVASLNSSVPYYLGHPVRDYSTVYNMEEAGYALSEGTLERLASYNFTQRGPCRSDLSVCLGRVLSDLRVPLLDTRDSLLRGRFNPFSPEDMIIPGSISVFSSYWRSSLFLSSEGPSCCSDQAITFHGVSPKSMYLMEYVVYSLMVYRNSPLGLANHPPNFSPNPNPKHNMIDGKPVVKLLSSDKNLKLVSKLHKEHPNLANLWNDLFSL